MKTMWRGARRVTRWQLCAIRVDGSMVAGEFILVEEREPGMFYPFRGDSVDFDDLIGTFDRIGYMAPNGFIVFAAPLRELVSGDDEWDPCSLEIEFDTGLPLFTVNRTE